jgi:putative membrane protein
MFGDSSWLVGVLAAALCIAPAAAQTSDSSTRSGQGSAAESSRPGKGSDNTAPASPPGSTASGAGSTATDSSASGTGSTAADSSASAASGQASEDVGETLTKLHQANQSEIEMGKWMQQRAQNSKVKDFAKKMVKDHSSLDKEVTSFAKKKDVDLTGAPKSSDEQHMEAMKDMSGAQLDRHYMTMMVEDHQKDLSEIRSAEQRAKSSQQKDLAKLLDKSAKKVEGHLKDAQKIQRSLTQRQARTPR